jgi:uncharacterized protein YabN with tetrapyrrole methylase and pyrophosphatase domain
VGAWLLRVRGPDAPRRLRDARRPTATAPAASTPVVDVEPTGSLTVVGTGISLGVQLTPEARRSIVGADETLYLVADAAAGRWIEKLRPGARSLHPLYRSGEPRAQIYDDIVEAILGEVRAGKRVCAALYGHPGVADSIGHGAVRRATSEGFPAAMLPAVSAVDCLFADLGLDPGLSGCQIYEATDFVLYRRSVDTSAALILLQVAAVGSWRAEAGPAREGLRALAGYLRGLYPDEHRVILYEASPYPIADALVTPLRLEELGSAEPDDLATLYVPPSSTRSPDPAVLGRLGLATSD